MRLSPRRLFDQLHDVANIPKPAGQARSHCRRSADGTVNAGDNVEVPALVQFDLGLHGLLVRKATLCNRATILSDRFLGESSRTADSGFCVTSKEPVSRPPAPSEKPAKPRLIGTIPAFIAIG